jgi:hypothetical protein
MNRIKERDPSISVVVEIIGVLHGFLTFITTLAVQKLIYPNEEETDESLDEMITRLEGHLNEYYKEKEKRLNIKMTIYE